LKGFSGHIHKGHGMPLGFQEIIDGVVSEDHNISGNCGMKEKEGEKQNRRETNVSTKSKSERLFLFSPHIFSIPLRV
jgi:hypothetical protein